MPNRPSAVLLVPQPSTPSALGRVVRRAQLPSAAASADGLL